ncbi:MAG TPA: MBL fold metallo-hydrolase [Kiritimatiellia bacterium]|nr:MBL fold metallo-hydrolase [Kiritimatiellia bacterium]HMO99529.1 MBL fold metallo-hydrolase [Kiritimatiellia bacterium]
MKVTPLIASQFTSDGGAMFGLVPKTIWSRLITPDDDNRIRQDAHVLLVELDDGRKGLVDTGCGSAEKFSEKEVALHGLGPGWPLLERFISLGIDPASLAFVVFSHLHWDHAGGAATGEPGALTPVFPQADHFVHALEWESAVSGDPLLYKSYPADVVEPLKQLGPRLHAISADRKEILPGITLVRSGGHTRGHAVIVLEDDAGIEVVHPESMFLFPPRRIVFAGDVCPMRHNLRMVFQTAYDTFPLETRRWKQAWLPEMASDGTLILFDHDPDLFGATIKPHNRREFVIDKTLHTDLSAHQARSLDELEKKGRFSEYKDQEFITG